MGERVVRAEQSWAWGRFVRVRFVQRVDYNSHIRNGD